MSEFVQTAHRRVGKFPRTAVNKSANPLQAGILAFCAQPDFRKSTAERVEAKQIPKRFTLYSSLLLLPANFATHSLEWAQLYASLAGQARYNLFESVASAFGSSGKLVTHIAINAPISANEEASSDENRVRSPFNLEPVFGDFGPSTLSDAANTATPADFDAAFWVSTSQLAGITQVWAPRWTMFSRGNLSEKGRILRQNGKVFPGMTEAELGTTISQTEVVDMYVGIGYFAFSYLHTGVKRVWGWDLNPWSIEGLRRGCEQNGWRCIVVHVADDGTMLDCNPSQLACVVAETDKEASELPSLPVRCVAFLGDNKWAAQIITSIQLELAQYGTSRDSSVRHVNLGLLPTSRSSWENAVRMVGREGGWLHAHENVDVQSIDTKARGIVNEITALAKQHKDGARAECEHIEQVKSYAPGVMHCVFDIKVL